MEAKLFRLKDGRNLAYAEYGKPDGIPVFYFHGSPGSHLLPENDIAAAARCGLRLILPIRPGYSLSDFKPDRTFLDWPDDVVELADFLRIPRFGVVGVSGGGPYAATCAYKIPERLTKVAVVSSLAPYGTVGEPEEKPSREEGEAWAAGFEQSIKSDPEAFFANMLAGAPEEDRTILAGAKEFFLATFTEGLRQGWKGHLAEMELLFFGTWGFALEDVQAAVYLWHGEADTNVPVENGRYLVAHIPNCKATFLPGVGHMISDPHWDTIFSIFNASGG